MSDRFNINEGALSNSRQRQSASNSRGGQSPAPYSTSAFGPGPPRPPTTPKRSIARQRNLKRSSRSRKRAKEWAWVFVAGGMIAIFGFVVLAMLVLVRLPHAAQVAIPTADLRTRLPTPVDARTHYTDGGQVVGVDVLPLDDGEVIELQPWDSQSRLTMIVGGVDRRPEEVGWGYRTDSLMLISIDPVTDQIGILSIPRDLLVQVPGFEDRLKINTVLAVGEGQRYNYGPDLLKRTVQWNFGIRVHNYVLMDFQALIDIVDIIDGIEITIDYTINDQKYPDMNYGYDPLLIPAGTHMLGGYDALRFARTRHGNNDMRRAERQQQVLYAIRDRILDFNMIPQLILQAPQLWSSLTDNLHTDLGFKDIIQLALFAKDVNRESISSGVMDYNYVEDFTTADGLFALIPKQAQLNYLMNKVFGGSYLR